MKKLALSLCLVITAVFSMAFVTIWFPGWDALIKRSSGIAVVRWINPDETYLGDALIGAHIAVVDVLKGQTNISSTTLLRTHVMMRQGEYYLVFSYTWDNDNAPVADDYQVVLVGTHYEKGMAAGDSLEEKVRSLLKRRLGFLTRQIEQEQKEKERLEQAFH